MVMIPLHEKKQSTQPMGILLTRPKDDSLKLAHALQSRIRTSSNHPLSCYIQPLLQIEPLKKPLLNYTGEEIIFTSRHGVRFFMDFYGATILQNTSIWCVGEETHKTLKTYGVHSKNPPSKNGKDLLNVIQSYSQSRDIPPSFLHVRGKDTTVDFEHMLKPFCKGLMVYQTHSAAFLRNSVVHAFQKRNIHVILLFSQKSARTLRILLKKAFPHNEAPFEHIPLLGLSTPILSVFQKNPSSVCATTKDMIKMVENFLLNHV